MDLKIETNGVFGEVNPFEEFGYNPEGGTAPSVAIRIERTLEVTPASAPVMRNAFDLFTKRLVSLGEDTPIARLKIDATFRWLS